MRVCWEDGGGCSMLELMVVGESGSGGRSSTSGGGGGEAGDEPDAASRAACSTALVLASRSSREGRTLSRGLPKPSMRSLLFLWYVLWTTRGGGYRSQRALQLGTVQGCLAAEGKLYLITTAPREWRMVHSSLFHPLLSIGAKERVRSRAISHFREVCGVRVHPVLLLSSARRPCLCCTPQPSALMYARKGQLNTRPTPDSID